MLLAVLTVFVAALFKAVWWGVGENRQFSDRGAAVQTGFLHFTSYHIWMLKHFLILDVGFASAINAIIFGDSPFWMLCAAQVVLCAFLVVWDILVLDVVWWINRYMDVTHLGGAPWKLCGFVIWRFPSVNLYDGGSGKAWHSREDWDAAGLPLWFGVYSWWWLCGFALVGLGWGYAHLVLLA